MVDIPSNKEIETETNKKAITKAKMQGNIVDIINFV